MSIMNNIRGFIFIATAFLSIAVIAFFGNLAHNAFIKSPLPHDDSLALKDLGLAIYDYNAKHGQWPISISHEKGCSWRLELCVETMSRSRRYFTEADCADSSVSSGSSKDAHKTPEILIPPSLASAIPAGHTIYVWPQYDLEDDKLPVNSDYEASNAKLLILELPSGSIEWTESDRVGMADYLRILMNTETFYRYEYKNQILGTSWSPYVMGIHADGSIKKYRYPKDVSLLLTSAVRAKIPEQR
jgi:hypothetical protein